MLTDNMMKCKIAERIEWLMEAGIISEYTKRTIVDMADKVLAHIARWYENIREGVKQVIGGRVLDYEAKRIKNEDIKEGRVAEIIETGDDFGFPDKEILDKLQIKLDIFLQKAKDYVTRFGKQTV